MNFKIVLNIGAYITHCIHRTIPLPFVCKFHCLLIQTFDILVISICIINNDGIFSQIATSALQLIPENEFFLLYIIQEN